MARTQADRKAETRRRLLEAAADQFAREGFHATSTDAVADAADRTSGSVYAHFGGKEGLLLALVEEMKESVALRILSEIVGARAVDEKIAALWRGFANSEPWILLEHELWLYAARNPEERERLADRYDRERETLADEIEAWRRHADPDALAPSDLSVLTLALILGLEMQRRVDPSVVPDELVVAGIERLLGLTSDVDLDHDEHDHERVESGKAL